MYSKITNLCWQIFDLLLANKALPSITPLRSIKNTSSSNQHTKHIYSFEFCRHLRQILTKCDNITEIQTAQKIIKTLQHSVDKNGNVLLPSVLTYIEGYSDYYYDDWQLLYFNGIYDSLPSFDVLQEFINSEFFHNEYFPLMECWKLPYNSFTKSLRNWSNINKTKFTDAEEIDNKIENLIEDQTLWNILFIRDLFGDFMYKQMFNTLQTASIELNKEFDFPILYDNAIHAVLSYWFKSDFLFLYEDKTERTMLKRILSKIHKMDNQSINWFLDNSFEILYQKHKSKKIKLDGEYYFKLYQKQTYSVDVLERLLPFFLPSIHINEAVMLLAKGLKSERITTIFSEGKYLKSSKGYILWVCENKYNECCNLFAFMKLSSCKINQALPKVLKYFAANRGKMTFIKLLFKYFFRYCKDKNKEVNSFENMEFFIKQLLLKKNNKNCKSKFNLEQYISIIFGCMNFDAFELVSKNNFLKVSKMIKNKHINEMMKLVIPRVIVECNDGSVIFFERIVKWIVSKKNDKNKKLVRKFMNLWIENSKYCQDNRWHNILVAIRNDMAS